MIYEKLLITVLCKPIKIAGKNSIKIMKQKVEFKEITGFPKQVAGELYNAITEFQKKYKVKIGITGRDPQLRFNEHLISGEWKRMVVLYSSISPKHVNELEK